MFLQRTHAWIYLCFSLYLTKNKYLCAANTITLDCGDTSCGFGEYHCDEGEACTIECLSTLACAASTFYCPSNYDCDIVCDPTSSNGASACYNSIVHAEQSSKLTITVTAHKSNAQQMTIYAPLLMNEYESESIMSQIKCAAGNQDTCSDLEIYSKNGFNDVRLSCTGASPSIPCSVSGEIYCGWDYDDEHCDSLQQYDNTTGYICNSNQLDCVDYSLPPTSAPTNSAMDAMDTTTTTIATDTTTSSMEETEQETTTTSTTASPPDNQGNSNGNNNEQANTIEKMNTTTSKIEMTVDDGSSVVVVREDTSSSMLIVLIICLVLTCIFFVSLAICGVIYVQYHSKQVSKEIHKTYRQNSSKYSIYSPKTVSRVSHQNENTMNSMVMSPRLQSIGGVPELHAIPSSSKSQKFARSLRRKMNQYPNLQPNIRRDDSNSFRQDSRSQFSMNVFEEDGSMVLCDNSLILRGNTITGEHSKSRNNHCKLNNDSLKISVSEYNDINVNGDKSASAHSDGDDDADADADADADDDDVAEFDIETDHQIAQSEPSPAPSEDNSNALKKYSEVLVLYEADENEDDDDGSNTNFDNNSEEDDDDDDSEPTEPSIDDYEGSNDGDDDNDNGDCDDTPVASEIVSEFNSHLSSKKSEIGQSQFGHEQMSTTVIRNDSYVQHMAQFNVAKISI